MKKLAVLSVFVIFAISASAQNLIDIYKKGTIKLIPDLEYAKGNDWNKVFSTYYDTLYGRPMGNRKSLKVMPDGSVVVNHEYRNFYTKFSPTGKFVKEFGITNSKGERFKKTKNIAGILNDKVFFTELDNMGKMVCFDFDGNYIKTLTLDYMTKQMIPLPNNKIAVVGWVIWSDKFRDFVAIVDYETNEQKIIWEHFTSRYGNNDKSYASSDGSMFHYQYQFKDKGLFSFSTMPHTRSTGISSPPKIAQVGNKLIVGIPPTGEILIYDLDGNLMAKDKIDWATNYLSVEEQREIQEKAIEKFKNLKETKLAEWVSDEESKRALETVVKEMEADLNKISKPIPIPTFSTIIKDSDGNILFFEYPKEENANLFNVWIYEGNGKFVCQSSFVCDEYELQIMPSKMVFHDVYLYALQLKKNTTGVPLRLVRFRMGSE